MNPLNVPIIKGPSPHWEFFKMLYKDFETSFQFIHPVESHFKVYSMRHYEFLLRACTEFESVCKGEVIRAGLARRGEQLGIGRYSKLESNYDRKLSSYEVGFKFDSSHFVRPLGSWAKGDSLHWYKDYNEVKHNRLVNFEHANLENVLEAIAGLFVILLAARLCPEGKLGIGTNQLIRWNEEWPVVLRKDGGDGAYNRKENLTD